VPGDRHRHALTDARVDHVPCRGAPKVVFPSARHAHTLARPPPTPTDAFPWFASTGAT
jgi:hypothetical protein